MQITSVILLDGKERLDCKIHVDGARLEQVSQFKNLGYVLDESCTEDAEYLRKVPRERKVAGAMRSLANDRVLQIQYERVLHEAFVVPVMLYGYNRMV